MPALLALCIFVAFATPPIAVSWTLVHVTNALVKGPERRRREHRTKQYRRRAAECESVEICPHGWSVFSCRCEGLTECSDRLRARILWSEFADLTTPPPRRRGLTETGEWLATMALAVVLAVVLFQVIANS